MSMPQPPRSVLMAEPSNRSLSPSLKINESTTGHAYLLEIRGLFNEGSRPGRTFRESVGGILKIDRSDWSNGIRYQVFDTRPDTEFKHVRGMTVGDCTDKTA